MAGKRKTMGDALALMKVMQPPARPEPGIDAVPADVAVIAEPAPEVEPALDAAAPIPLPGRPVAEVHPDTPRIVSAPVTETMRPALKDRMPTAYQREPVSTRTRSHVEKERLAKETKPARVPRGYNVRPPRIEKPHQSVYADPAVWKVIRQIAITEDVKPQDLYREGLRHVLKRRGFDFDKLDRGEA